MNDQLYQFIDESEILLNIFFFLTNIRQLTLIFKLFTKNFQYYIVKFCVIVN